MREKFKSILATKKNRLILLVIGMIITCVLVLVLLTIPSRGEPKAPDTVSSYSEQDVDKIDFSLKNNTPEDVKKAKELINDYLEKESKQNYVVSFNINSVKEDEEATIWIRKRFFSSEYVKLNKLSADYVIKHMIAIIAEYTVDYDNTLVPYDEGKVTKAFYLLKNDSGWTIWQSDTLSTESN